MMTFWRALTLLIAGWMVPVVAAAAESPRDLLELMITPDLVLGRAEAIGLSAPQRQAVQRIQSDLQPRMLPLLRQMRSERDALVALLRAEKADEGAILDQFEKLNGVETELKRLRLQMTVGVMKVLTAEQRATARTLQEKRLSEGGPEMGTDTLPAKLRRVKDGLEQWKREGRDVAPLRELWERFQAAEDKGHYRQARQALDEAIALLDAPPARR
jgi:Spy/CpxP family protein refolding chaperone